MKPGVLFDVDGTLVDTNYLHAVAWGDAFDAHGHDVPMSTIHGLIGQGSERLVESAIGKAADDVVDTHADIFESRLHRLRPFAGAGDLLRHSQQGGLTVVLATSASAHDAKYLQAAIGADEAIHHTTTSDDAENSKPAPDIVAAALSANDLNPGDCVFVGDTVWDVEAAKRAGVPCVCVLTGGIPMAALREAGAIEVYESVAHLLEEFDSSPLGALLRRAA